MVYLASPYSHEDYDIRCSRYRLVLYVATVLIARGIPVLSPIVHCHPIVVARPDMPVSWEFWRAYDTALLRSCDELWVLCIDGWRESVGVQAEIEIAREAGMPIKYCDGDGSILE